MNQQADNKVCCQSLFAVWLSRSLLMVGLFTLAVFFIETPKWGAYTPSIILVVMAALYLVSRFVYIPIPHLAFFKLLPFAKQLPYSIQLGLTLPACTLPLVIVTAGMAVTLGSVSFAAIAGLLFASLFTLPMIIATYKGIHDDAKQLLNHAAKGSPYLTAVLLLGLQLYCYYLH